MRAALMVGLALALPLPAARAQYPSQSAFWKGKFEIFQFNLRYGIGVENQNLVDRSMELWKSVYDLYQDAEGVAREELTHLNRNRSVEGPLDVRILDYSRGEGLVFDKGGPSAIRGPLRPPATGQALEAREILGFTCDGTEYRWTTFQQATVQLQRWTARDSSLKVPLLEVEYFTDNTGAMLSLTVRVVSKLEKSPQLPASLFEPPKGLKITEVPDIE
jgi:hypothetical protein